MIEQVIPYINTRIATLNIFSKMFGLCDKISLNDTSFPAEYCKGEYKQISDFDFNKGTIYHRLIGDIESQESEDDTTVSCETYIERTYPMKAVGVVKKNTLNAYSDSIIAEKIAKQINFNNSKTLSQILLADTVSAVIKSISTDREKIFKDEFEKIDNKIPYEYSIIAVEYQIKITGNESCFSIACADYNSDYNADYLI